MTRPQEPRRREAQASVREPRPETEAVANFRRRYEAAFPGLLEAMR